jgi:hypothetical protein
LRERLLSKGFNTQYRMLLLLLLLLLDSSHGKPLIASFC